MKYEWCVNMNVNEYECEYEISKPVNPNSWNMCETYDGIET